MPTCAIVSFRLGQADGVSVIAESWGRSLEALGFDVVTVAGDGPVDRLVPGLAWGADEPPEIDEVDEALLDADLVLVENLLSTRLGCTCGELNHCHKHPLILFGEEGGR